MADGLSHRGGRSVSITQWPLLCSHRPLNSNEPSPARWRMNGMTHHILLKVKQDWSTKQIYLLFVYWYTTTRRKVTDVHNVGLLLTICQRATLPKNSLLTKTCFLFDAVASNIEIMRAFVQFSRSAHSHLLLSLSRYVCNMQTVRWWKMRYVTACHHRSPLMEVRNH